VVQGRKRELFIDELKILGRNLGIEKQLIFTGHRSDILNIMNSIDAFVLSSRTLDSLPGVVLEAMYCSRPVVGVDAGGVPEEVDDGVTGFLYSPGDVIQLAEKIISLLTNPELAREMGKAGKKRVEQVFNKKILYARMEDIYKNMLGALN
jgi:glycosyltransferase involved in cell wall biosynthesis